MPFFPSKYSKLLLEDNCLYSQVSRKEWHWKKCIRITKKPQLHPHNCQTLVSGCALISETSCLLTSHASLSPFFSWYFHNLHSYFFKCIFNYGPCRTFDPSCRYRPSLHCIWLFSAVGYISVKNKQCFRSQIEGKMQWLLSIQPYPCKH